MPAYGRLIGVSLGPGDPGLITRRAWEALGGNARWAYPVKRAAAGSYALDIARRAGLPLPADALELVFPMTRDPRALAGAWSRAAATCLEALEGGRDLLFLVEGDASTYSTFRHLARALRTLAPGLAVETVAGVSAFAAAAAHADLPLAEEDDTLAVIPAAYGVEVVERLLDAFDTLVLLKVKPLLDEVLDLLARRGLLAHSCFVEKVGAPEQRLVRDLAGLRGAKVNYLSLLLVRNPYRLRGELRRGCRSRRASPAALSPAEGEA